MLFSQLKRRNHKLHVHTNDRLSSGLLTQRKTVRRDPANPTWDPDRDFGTSRMGSRLESQVGSRQSHPGSLLHSRQNPVNPAWDSASNPRWDPANPTREPSFVPRKIPPIPPSNLHLSVWDPANPTWDPKICTS